MSSFIDALETGLGVVKSNPVIQKYAEPILFAVFTGAGEIDLPQGKIKISQQGAPVKFTLGSAIYAVEQFLLTDDTSIQMGTTKVEWIDKQNAQAAPQFGAPQVPAPAVQ